jgi:hypothetical protein
MIIGRAKANGQRAASLGTQHAPTRRVRIIQMGSPCRAPGRGVAVWVCARRWELELGSGNDASVVHVAYATYH